LYTLASRKVVQSCAYGLGGAALVFEHLGSSSNEANFSGCSFFSGVAIAYGWACRGR
jgi:hypothetical protein